MSIEAAVNHSRAVQEALARCKAEVEELRSQIQHLNEKLATCKDKATSDGDEIRDQNPSSPLLSFVKSSSHQPSPYCLLLPRPIPSTISFWNSILPDIVQASQHALDKRFALHDFTAGLLHLISPDRMARSTMSLPHDWTPVRRVLEVLYARYQHLTQRGPEARKLKILVMGGSLIVGVNCRKIVSDYSLHMQMPNRLCTWTHRLESLLNKLLGDEYVEVHKIALGGTNTQTGFVMWDSNFLPDETKNPDILINAYSTNDMHILTVLQAKEGNQTLRDKVMEMTQDFVRAVLKDGPCAPLLLHMDDYLGNEQREILTTTELSQAVAVLAQYYGFTSMSYANVVRDIVYGDTHEFWISPQGWYNDFGKGNVMEREIHPGMAMHIMSSWVTAYTMLNLGLTYCSIEGFLADMAVADQETERPYQAIHGLPRLRNGPVIPGKPKGRPAGLPPPISKSLSLENVTELWRAAKPVGSLCEVKKSMTNDEDRCPFSWFSGISKQGQNETYAAQLFSSEHNRFVTKNKGWGINTAGKKLGISPTNTQLEGQTIQIDLESYVLSTVTLFYMKSYGEKWEGSRVAFTITRNEGQVIARDELAGIHEKLTSETYTHRVEIPTPSDGKGSSNYRIELELIGGTTFKIMGLAICK
jgi:lysophospholipase L1-like esterase